MILADGFEFDLPAARQLSQVHTALSTVTDGVALTTGQEFFAALLREITRVLGARFAFIAEAAPGCEGGQPTHARPLAYWVHDRIMHVPEIPLASSPCLSLMMDGFLCVERNLREAYPRNAWIAEHGVECYVGVTLPHADGRPATWFSILDTKPLANRELAEALLKHFAHRVAAEIERMHSENVLRASNMILEHRIAERTAALQSALAERERVEQQLLRDAFTDPLTGLPNRAVFLDRVGRAVERIRRHPGRHFAVLSVDIDRFKVVNDSLGHTAGDTLLVEMARRLGGALRPEDTIARLAGDEFAILIEEIADEADATRIAERVRRHAGARLHIRAHEIFPSTSIGIVLGGRGEERAEELLRDAQTAMHRAKDQGRARCQLFDVTMHARAVALLQTESELRLGIRRGELRLHFQPIICLRTGHISAVEALVRWQHPTRGLLGPGAFLRVAEETGLAHSLDEWVIREACRFAREIWRARGLPVPISINLGAAQFARGDLANRIARLMSEHQLDGRALRVEITETGLMTSVGEVAGTLAALQAIGVALLVDDFGTGYSSLSYLQRFPIHTLKIDRSFVQNVASERSNREIVRGIVTLAHALDMEVIAEGVERPDELRTLRELGCEHVQGFLVATPMAGEALLAFLARERKA